MAQGTSPTLPLPVIILHLDGVMLNWEGPDEVAIPPRPAPGTVVIRQLLRQHLPKLQDDHLCVGVLLLVQDEGVCDGNIKQELRNVLVKFPALHP